MRYGWRALRHNPGVSIAAVLSLALGAGANTAMFQLFDAVGLRRLPVRAPGELLDIRVDDMTHARGAWLRDAGLTNPLWERIRSQRDAFAGAFAWADDTLDVSTLGELRKVSALWVSGGMFPVLGLEAARGRLFVDADDRRGCGAGPGVVLSYRFWQHEFGGDPAIAGKPVSLGAIRTTVLGVTPRDFFGLEVGRGFDIALPICAEPAWHAPAAPRLDSGTVWWLTVMARRRPEMSLEQTAARLRAASPAIFEATLPAGYPAASVKPYLAMKLVATPAPHGVSRLRTAYARPVALLWGITALVLLIACVNVAHLTLARAHARRRELAIRVSLGASGRRLAEQWLAESVLLAAIGVGAGLPIARLVCDVLLAFVASGVPNAFLGVSIDARAFAYAVLLVLVVTATSAFVPVRRAFFAARQPGAGDRHSTEGRGHAQMRHLLLVSQVAFSLTLLVGALLFVRTLRNLQTFDPGFRPDGVLIADVRFADLPPSSDRAVALRRELLERVRALPGIAAAAETVFVPLAGGNWNNRVWLDGSDPDHAQVVMRNMIGDGYFRAMNTAVHAGREFTALDLAATAPKVAIVNRRFAELFGLGARAVGVRFFIEPTPLEPRASYEIVGVVANTKYHDLREPDPPILYVPLWRTALRRPSGQFIFRAAAPGDSLAADARAVLDGLGAVRYSFRPYSAVLEESLLRERLMAALAWPFGVLALVLTALGLYGVFSYWVVQRTREIGIRMALGAARAQVVASILRDVVLVLAAGTAAGAILIAAGGRVARSLLFGLSAFDPAALSIAVAVLASAAMLAAFIPARRAATVDPALVLRQN